MCNVSKLLCMCYVFSSLCLKKSRTLSYIGSEAPWACRYCAAFLSQVLTTCACVAVTFLFTATYPNPPYISNPEMPMCKAGIKTFPMVRHKPTFVKTFIWPLSTPNVCRWFLSLKMLDVHHITILHSNKDNVFEIHKCMFYQYNYTEKYKYFHSVSFCDDTRLWRLLQRSISVRVHKKYHFQFKAISIHSWKRVLL